MKKVFEGVEDVLEDEHFVAWFSGDNDEKAAVWTDWLAVNSQYNDLVNEAVSFLKAIYVQEKSLSDEQVAESFQKTQNRILPAARPPFPGRRIWFAAAAVIGAVVLGGYIVKQLITKPQEKTIETKYGQLAQQLLPDGSQVTLNAHTEVTINNWKTDTDRELWLKGEAFFHVKKTPANSRFIVHTERLDIIVTGTQFNVQNLSDKTNVFLTEGSVTLKLKDGKQISMKPGDFVSIDGESLKKDVTTDTAAVLAWRNSKLSFDKTPIREAIKIISRHYGVEIKMSDPAIGEKTISGMMPNDNLDVFLKSLEAVTDFKITRNANEIMISEP